MRDASRFSISPDKQYHPGPSISPSLIPMREGVGGREKTRAGSQGCSVIQKTHWQHSPVN